MKKKGLAVAVILLFIGMCVVPSTAVQELREVSSIGFDRNTLYVGGSGPNNYTTIQSAISDAVDGDTVFVYDDSSPYVENVVVDKSIVLKGEDKETTIIDGNDTFSGSAVTIQKDNVSVENFTIQHGSTYGIKIYTSHNTILNNVITQNNFGIDLYGDFRMIKDNRICYNQIINNSRGCIDTNGWVTETTISHNVLRNSPEGVDLGNSDNIVSNNLFENAGFIELGRVTNNSVNNNVLISVYIELYDSRWVEIKNNAFVDSRGIVLIGDEIDEWDTHTIENNSINGKLIYFYKHASGVTIPSDAAAVILVGSTQCVIQDIVFSGGAGIRLAYSSYNSIIGNTIMKITGVESGIYLQASSNNNLSYNSINNGFYGIELDTDSSNNFMYRNIIKNNTEVGIFCRGSSNTLIENHIADNLCGMRLVFASDTIIRKNNFINNRFHALFIVGYWDKHSNQWQSNFYSPQIPRAIKIIFGAVRTPFYYEEWGRPSEKVYLFRPGFNFDWNPAQEPYDIGV